jgi:hypothetical protein
VQPVVHARETRLEQDAREQILGYVSTASAPSAEQISIWTAASEYGVVRALIAVLARLDNIARIAVEIPVVHAFLVGQYCVQVIATVLTATTHRLEAAAYAGRVLRISFAGIVAEFLAARVWTAMNAHGVSTG